ncbi:hypothetical protein D5E77_25380 [Vibrio parahaemolyticus]|nr:hypothetical protein D5E77_25380 [Vibrio parahaemolyticus]
MILYAWHFYCAFVEVLRWCAAVFVLSCSSINRPPHMEADESELSYWYSITADYLEGRLFPVCYRVNVNSLYRS